LQLEQERILFPPTFCSCAGSKYEYDKYLEKQSEQLSAAGPVPNSCEKSVFEGIRGGGRQNSYLTSLNAKAFSLFKLSWQRSPGLGFDLPKALIC
jgi:hypothetical protein